MILGITGLENIKAALESRSKLLAVLTFGVMLSFAGKAQQINGFVYDEQTKEALPFADVYLKGTTTGMTTGMDGAFTVNADGKHDGILVISFIGYIAQEIEVNGLQDTLKVYLKPNTHQLGEVVVKPDYSYDEWLFRKILKNKRKNNPDRFQSFYFQEYTRLTVFLTNLDKKIKEKESFKGAEDAFVSKDDSTVMMPFFMSENLVEKQYNGKWDENLLTRQSDGIMDGMSTEINSVLNTKLTGQLNFYKNQIEIMGRGFPGPLSRSALSLYNIYLADSTMVDGVKHYKFDFYPKNYKNITFKGYFWVENESFALIEMQAELPNSANINFVKDYKVNVIYEKNGQGDWFYKQQRTALNLTLGDKESTKNNSFDVRQLIDFQEVTTELADGFTFKYDAFNQNDKDAPLPTELLEKMQLTPMDSFEASAYNGIKQLKETPLIRQIDKIGATALTGYYNIGKVDVGPFFEIYQTNAIEGSRLTIPLRTSEKMFRNFSVGGYVGYGFKNKSFKYGGSVKYLLPTQKRTILSLEYRDDYLSLSKNRFNEFVRENPFNKGSGNIITTITTTQNKNIVQQQRLSLTIEHQVKKDIGILFRPFYNRFKSNELVGFQNLDKQFSSFDNYGGMMNVRFSFGQDYDEGYFSRVYYGNQKPVINMAVEFGKNTLPNVSLPNDGLYTHLHMSVKNKVNFGQTYLRVLLDGGYIIGEVPFPLLQMPRGTEGAGFARYHFNLLHHASFASDLYANAHLSFNGGGILFNKIPLIRELNLREAISFKAHYGRLKGDHNKVFSMPGTLSASPKYPYMEMGVGITNIFKCLRIEYVRRLNNDPLLDKVSAKHGLRLRVEVNF